MIHRDWLAIIVAWCLMVLVCLAFWGVTIYVAVHYIRKYW